MSKKKLSNKKLGNNFENELVSWLAAKGCWVHKLAPNRAGAQPFDIIAAKSCWAWAIDCKVCSNGEFDRGQSSKLLRELAEKDKAAMEKWEEDLLFNAYFALKLPSGKVHWLSYGAFKALCKEHSKLTTRQIEELPLLPFLMY